MRLRDVINQFKNSPQFLLTINEVCEEYSGRIEDLMKEDYYKKYQDWRVKGMHLMSINMRPELCIHIEKGGSYDT